jgi:hypothetical protein
MRPKRGHARSVEDCLLADAGLARLSTHAHRLLRLQRIFESATPLARQSRIANLRLGKIVIHANNGTVATKLRQLQPRLSAVFQSEAPEVTGIDIRVQPGTGNRPRIEREITAEIGPQQKRSLTSLANGLREGSALKDALKRLVDRTKVR